MLSAYCRRGCREGQVLPEELTSWLAAQQRRSTADRPRPPQPYVATRNGAHLVVEWISGDASGALLLTEAVNSDYGLIPKVATLTRRETEVLWLVAHGHKNAAIARRLGIGPRTVEHHLANTYQKLGVHSRTEAMLHAFGTRLPLPARRPGDTGLKDSAVG